MNKLVILTVLLGAVSAQFGSVRQPSNSLTSPFGPKKSFASSKPAPFRAAPAAARVSSGPEQQATIVRSEQEVNFDGTYRFAFQTDNGISAQEQGASRQKGQEQSEEASGSFQYTAPDGTPIEVSYIADENGFQPQGAHLPTPPPIPEAILRALEYIRTHPQVEDNRRKF